MIQRLAGAACAELEVDQVDRLFFGTPKRTDYARAKAVCRRCPVRLACLELALEAEALDPLAIRFGVYGGLTPAERAPMRRPGQEVRA